MTPELYACLGSGNCFKPWLAFHQLDRAFELKIIDVLAGEQKSPSYLKVNPLGVVPYLVTETGFGIGESNAMLWHIAEDTHLMPQSRDERAEALQWMFFEQSKLEPFISPARFFTTILPQQREERASDIAVWQDNALNGLMRLEAHLSERKFVLSSGYSIADIAIYGYTHVLEEAGLTLEDYPAIARWIDDVAATDNYRPLVALGHSASAAA
ncbi:glutathione S-transferase family protein [uncultured Roseobacter sp.]|uniref:glutathione S-transferase family protein n=1 Tax=uncultured Roseobacter sp. TaxID=114847 RepID=UPI00261934A1|nr:glutathione S-transferase family protein [uncultured Roseobacter sp.]